MYGAHFTHLTVVSNKRSCTPLFGATVNCDFPFQILLNSVSHFNKFHFTVNSFSLVSTQEKVS